MRKKEDLKRQAIKLRKQGYSYSEIALRLSIAQGSCSLWLHGIPLSAKAKNRIRRLQETARLKGVRVVQEKIAHRTVLLQKQTNKFFSKIVISEDIGKLFCALLYWAEGEKRTNTVAFSNSDPHMVKTFLTLLRAHFRIKPDKLRALLHLHEYHDVAVQKKYWSMITGIPSSKISIYKKPNSGRNIREGYPGCISIRYHDVVLAKEIELLYNALVKHYGDVG
jgi:transposase-like protein